MDRILDIVDSPFYSPFEHTMLKGKEEDGKWIVYLVVNTLNNKVYIGQTCKGLVIRRYQHLRKAKYKEITYFQNALNKYGETNFKWSILTYAMSKKDANTKEQYWIAAYKATDSQFGYNQTYGGEGGLLTSLVLEKISRKKKGQIPWNKGIACSEATKLKISQANKGRIAYNKGVPMSEEQKCKLSDVKKGCVSSFKGKCHSEEAKLKIGLKSKGRQTRKGCKLTEETKRKISTSLKRRAACVH